MRAEICWQPSDAVIARARITDYQRFLREKKGLTFADYQALWRWSVDDLEAFWASIWEYYDIKSATPYSRVLGKRTMPGAEWFPGATLNYVDQVFRHRTSARPAVLAGDESGAIRTIEWATLEREVANVAARLSALGVGKGDRVVAFMPNVPETLVAFLAAASLGAIWSVCSPDMGAASVLDRFRQIEPKILFAVDGYRYNGKPYDRRATVKELLAGLPTVERLVLVPALGSGTEGFTNALAWPLLTQGNATLAPTPMPFDHPLWVVYSSGTTGMPKPMVHGHGGTILEHVKLMSIHNDLGADDIYHWFSSTSWFMWNLHICGLLVGSTIAIYDGNPGYPDWGALWRFAANTKVTVYGAGAALHLACMKAGIVPREIVDVSRIRAVGSTGSPLPPEAYTWLYEKMKRDVWIAPMSGGTDPGTAFIGGCPTVPLRLGEMQVKCLGVNIMAYDDAGQEIIDDVGELVLVSPMPSLPLYFWNDAGGQRYHDSYFDMYPGVWRHGDWVKFAADGGSIVYGRSDATIKRHGIRMGTADVYRLVEDVPEVMDSLVVDLEYLGRESYMPLFVVLKPGVKLDDALIARIKERIRAGLSGRHVPNEIFQIDEVPRTLSGKKMELPIKRLLLGHAIEKVANRDSMANPRSLDYFVELAQRRG